MPITTTDVKGRQVRIYYRLLHRLGFEALFEAMTRIAATSPPATGPTSPGTMVAEVPARDLSDIQVSLDFAEIFRACAGADDSPSGLTAIDELAQAVLDLTDEEAAAGEWSVGALTEGYRPFCEASARPLQLLISPQFALG